MKLKLKSASELVQAGRDRGILPSSPTQADPPPIPRINPGQSPRPAEVPEEPTVEMDREQYVPAMFPNPAIYLQTLYPELKLHPWQFELLMLFAGYIDPRKFTDLRATPDRRWTALESLKLALSICNGGGKDNIILAGCSTWQIVSFKSARSIITSASHGQLRGQTEPHITNIAARHNRLFTRTFESVHYRHTVPANGSQIEMFCTDDPNLAEGYHPWDGGTMSLWFNEGKSIVEPVLMAARRWTGFTHWIYISSAGARSGSFYNAFQKARDAGRELPKTITEPNVFACRQITQYDCPHIPPSHIQDQIDELGLMHPFVQSMVFSNFCDYVEGSLIASDSLTRCLDVAPKDEDIGIGWDFAGGGDENAIVVRKGNRIIYTKFWRNSDTDAAVEEFDIYTAEFKHTNYKLNADNGGIGKAFIDRLANKGWRVTRRNNQSAPRDTRLYANMGAEMYAHFDRLLKNRLISTKELDPKMHRQLVARKVQGEDSARGKIALLPKKLQRSETGESPDRADGCVLCFYDYRPNFRVTPTAQAPHPLDGLPSVEEYFAAKRRNSQKANHETDRFVLL